MNGRTILRTFHLFTVCALLLGLALFCTTTSAQAQERADQDGRSQADRAKQGPKVDPPKAGPSETFERGDTDKEVTTRATPQDEPREPRALGRKDGASPGTPTGKPVDGPSEVFERGDTDKDVTTRAAPQDEPREPRALGRKDGASPGTPTGKPVDGPSEVFKGSDKDGEYGKGGLAPFRGALRDQVFNDDVIVIGSLCVGFDCVNGENFGFDTIKLKENNLRIKFDDTSTAGSFPKNDWQILVNDSANGGLSRFSVEDVTGGRIPFTIEAGASANSVYVESDGDVGFGNNNPVVRMHATDGDTPTLRLEQNSSSGWNPQTWDLAGNETNFFIRDATNGSTLPFRIRPGAASNMLMITGDDRVGINTASPSETFHVNGQSLIAGDDDTFPDEPMLTVNTTTLTEVGDPPYMTVDNDGVIIFGSSSDVNSRFTVKNRFVAGAVITDLLRVSNSGNLIISGTLTEGSSREIKENIVPVSGQDVLAKLLTVPVYQWNYIHDENKSTHMGPVAEEFHAAFGLGQDDKHISPIDMNGAMLAGLQTMQRENEALQARVAKLEAMLQALLEKQ